jgi:hypothetical protein
MPAMVNYESWKAAVSGSHQSLRTSHCLHAAGELLVSTKKIQLQTL